MFKFFSLGEGGHKLWLQRIGGEEINNAKGANLIIFDHHDSDIHPAIYGEHRLGKMTFGNSTLDTIYTQNYIFALDNEIKMLGINRGAHFLAAKAGCNIIQDVNNHGGHSDFTYHNILSQNGGKYWVNSAHHQMMNPYDMDTDAYNVIAVAVPRLSDKYLNQYDLETNLVKRNPPGIYNKEYFVEPEVIVFPKIRALAIQPNPEKLSTNSEGVEFLRQIVKHFML